MHQITSSDLEYADAFAGSVKAQYRQCDFDDLRSAAYEGLARARITFNTEKYPDVKFRHYAYKAVRQAVFSVVNKTLNEFSHTEDIDVDQLSDSTLDETPSVLDFSDLSQAETDLLDEVLKSKLSMAAIARAKGINPDTYYSQMRRITLKVKKL